MHLYHSIFTMKSKDCFDNLLLLEQLNLKQIIISNKIEQMYKDVHRTNNTNNKLDALTKSLVVILQAISKELLIKDGKL